MNAEPSHDILAQKSENVNQKWRGLAKSSKGGASDKDILDVALSLDWFMHYNFKAAEIGIMSH